MMQFEYINGSAIVLLMMLAYAAYRVAVGDKKR
jgi:hypothetical protein